MENYWPSLLIYSFFKRKILNISSEIEFNLSARVFDLGLMIMSCLVTPFQQIISRRTT